MPLGSLLTSSWKAPRHNKNTILRNERRFNNYSTKNKQSYLSSRNSNFDTTHRTVVVHIRYSIHSFVSVHDIIVVDANHGSTEKTNEFRRNAECTSIWISIRIHPRHQTKVVGVQSRKCVPEFLSLGPFRCDPRSPRNNNKSQQ